MDLRKNAITHGHSLIFIVALAVFVCRNLIFSSGIPAGTDTLGFISRASFLSKAHEYSYMWGSQSFGEIRQTSLETFLAVMNLVIQNPVIVSKIIIFMILLISGLSMYFFVYHCLGKRLPALISAFVYMINQFSISKLVSGHLNFGLPYAIAPLMFLVYYKSLKDGKFRSIISFSLIVSFIALFTRLDAIVYYFPFLVLFSIFIILFPFKGVRREKILFRHFWLVAVGGLLVFFLSAFQILPNLFGVRPGNFSTQTFFPMEYLINHSLNLYLTLLGTSRESGYLFWLGGTGWDSHMFLTIPQYRIAMSILPITAFAAMFFRKGRVVFFFLFSAVISIFLAKGMHPPSENIFLWGFQNIPFAGSLRVPNRWLAITYFSYAFLAGITVNALYVRSQSLKDLRLTGDRFSKPIKKILGVLPILFVVGFMITVSLGSWYVVSNGLQTWQIPKQESEPHMWVGNQSGDFRVATVPYWQAYMHTADYMRPSDFLNNGSWVEHDIGFESSLFHGRPVVGRGGWHKSTSDFVAFTCDLSLVTGTNNLMQILGLFNVKYLVVQGYLPTVSLPKEYPPTWERDFFNQQNGLTPVYSYENATVYENKFYTPHFFIASKNAMVVGGRETFTVLSTIKEFDFNKWALLFADDVVPRLDKAQLGSLLNTTDTLFFVNSEPLDLVALTLDDAIKIDAYRYAVHSSDSTLYWTAPDPPYLIRRGNLLLSSGDRVLSTSADASADIPLNVEESGIYDVFTRLSFGPGRGNLSMAIDDAVIGSIIPYARGYSGLKWVKMGTIALEKGEHIITLQNEESRIGSFKGKANDVDQILLVKPQDLKSAMDKTSEMVQENSMSEVYIYEGQQLFKWATTPNFANWWSASWPFNATYGEVASSQSRGYEENAWIPLNISLLTDNDYSIALRAAMGQEYGTLDIAVDGAHAYSVDFKSEGDETQFKWITFDPLTLKAGDHLIELNAKGKVEIDQMVLFSVEQEKSYVEFEEIFKTEASDISTVSYEKIDPTKYIVQVRTDSPVFIIFSDSYNHLWKAYIGETEIDPILTYSFVNGFYIPKTGEYDVTIEFTGQRYFRVGSVISILTFVFIMFYLLFEKRLSEVARRFRGQWFN